jgi:hypothetical protein
VRIPLEWDEQDEIPILYANQVMVSHMGPEFFLTFGVVSPPMVTDQLPDALHIRPQVRVAVAREAMPAMVKAMQDSLMRFQQAQRGAAGQGQGPTGPTMGGAPSGPGAVGPDGA